jgi:hypothetical protein
MSTRSAAISSLLTPALLPPLTFVAGFYFAAGLSLMLASVEKERQATR